MSILNQKTKVFKGGAGKSVRTTIPSFVAQILDIEVGDEVEWFVEMNTNKDLQINIRKVNTESNK